MIRQFMVASVYMCFACSIATAAPPHVHDGHCIALALDLVAIAHDIDDAEDKLDDLKRAHDRAYDDYAYALAHDFTIETIRDLFDAEVAAHVAYVDGLCDVEELKDEFRRTLVRLFQHCPLS